MNVPDKILIYSCFLKVNCDRAVELSAQNSDFLAPRTAHI